MIVKTLELDIYIPESNSLKDKRRVVKSLISRCRQKFNVSISEIDRLDDPRHTIIGLAIVTNTNSYGSQVLDKCLDFIEDEYRLEIITIERDGN